MLGRAYWPVLSYRICIPRRQFHATALLLAKRKVVHQFRLADIGEGITECEVISWNVKPFSVVQSFDSLCEVQSDKASVEITSPFDGTVTELLVKEGDVAKVGEGLCRIEVEEDIDEDVEETPTTPAPPLPDHKLEILHTQNVPHSIPHPLDPSHQVNPTSGRDILATPSVRHFAKQKGIDLSIIGVGSGKGGRIEKKDIEALLSKESVKQPSSPLPMAQTGDQEIELGRTRFAMWKSMTKSLEIPHFGYSTTLDLTKLSNLLPIFNSYIPSKYLPSQSNAHTLTQAVSPHSILSDTHSPSQADPQADPLMQFTRLTFLPLLLKTLSRAMLEWPLFRSSISYMPDPSSKRKPTIMIRSHADISIALSTPSGLYTPTLTAVNTQSTYEIMGHLQRLQRLGRQVPSALGPSEMPKRGGTVTVSNVGAIGKGEFASPILVPGGGLAIVAIGRARWVDVVPDDGIGAPRRRLQVGISWSADHRVVEGAELAAFVETWRSWVENPERLAAV